MFIENEDWNDEPDAQALSKTVLSNTQTSRANVKSKGVGKKSLLRTLQTLGSVPDWKSDAPQQGSDSETEAVPSHTKKKKKRSKKRKQEASRQEASRQEAESCDLDQGGKEEKTVTKKKKDKKSGPPKVKGAVSGRVDNKEIPKSAKVEVKQAENTEKLSRKQWKNRMKNKRKCINKYSQNKPEEDVVKEDAAWQQNPGEQLKVDSYSNNNKKSEKTFTQTPAQKNEKEHKPQKRKKQQEGKEASSTLDTQTLSEYKQLIKKEEIMKGSNHVRKQAFDSSGDKSKREAGEPQGKTTDEQQQSGPSKRLKLEASKEQSRKREKLRKFLHSQEPDNKPETSTERKEDDDETTLAEEKVKEASADRSASLRSRMVQRLEAARFRYINEVLYTTSSGDAKRMFKQDPQAFGVYHRGYTAQVQRWPANPVDAIIAYIRQKPPSLVVADFGCGDCKIARSVKNKVHSFDLAPTCDLVTVCDMANVPLPDETVDIAVFCLSLMGTNLADFLAEANRVLVMGGVLKIAEVTSRFDNVRSFLSALASLGFKLVSKDTDNSHFYSFEFVKTGDAPENRKNSGLQLKPCVYKKR